MHERWLSFLNKETQFKVKNLNGNVSQVQTNFIELALLKYLSPILLKSFVGKKIKSFFGKGSTKTTKKISPDKSDSTKNPKPRYF